MILAEVHDLLTLIPGSDYQIDEFGQDVLALSRVPALKTKDGHRLEFEQSGISREKVKRVIVHDENGLEHTFIAFRFVREA
jgi:hypothetical protein